MFTAKILYNAKRVQPLDCCVCYVCVHFVNKHFTLKPDKIIGMNTNSKERNRKKCNYWFQYVAHSHKTECWHCKFVTFFLSPFFFVTDFFYPRFFLRNDNLMCVRWKYKILMLDIACEANNSTPLVFLAHRKWRYKSVQLMDVWNFAQVITHMLVAYLFNGLVS